MNGDRNFTIVDDLLKCAFGNHPVDDPLVLPCQHSSCETCIKKYLTLTGYKAIICPLCENQCCVPIGGLIDLQKNDFLIKLKDYVNGKRRFADTTNCSGEHCSGKEATIYCEKCDYMCHQCTQIHQKTSVTARHKTIGVVDALKREREKAGRCPEHNHHVMELYCVECKVYLCPMCFPLKHNGHEFVELQIKVEMTKDVLHQVLGKVEDHQQLMRSHKVKIAGDITQIKQDINTGYDKIIRALQHKRENLLSEIDRANQDFTERISSLEDKYEPFICAMYTSSKCVDLLQRFGSPGDFLISVPKIAAHVQQEENTSKPPSEEDVPGLEISAQLSQLDDLQFLDVDATKQRLYRKDAEEKRDKVKELTEHVKELTNIYNDIKEEKSQYVEQESVLRQIIDQLENATDQLILEKEDLSLKLYQSMEREQYLEEYQEEKKAEWDDMTKAFEDTFAEKDTFIDLIEKDLMDLQTDKAGLEETIDLLQQKLKSQVGQLDKNTLEWGFARGQFEEKIDLIEKDLMDLQTDKAGLEETSALVAEQLYNLQKLYDKERNEKMQVLVEKEDLKKEIELLTTQQFGLENKICGLNEELFFMEREFIELWIDIYQTNLSDTIGRVKELSIPSHATCSMQKIATLARLVAAADGLDNLILHCHPKWSCLPAFNRVEIRMVTMRGRQDLAGIQQVCEYTRVNQLRLECILEAPTRSIVQMPDITSLVLNNVGGTCVVSSLLRAPQLINVTVERWYADDAIKHNQLMHAFPRATIDYRLPYLKT